MASIEDSTVPNSISQMVMEAIESQGEKQGLNESEVLTYIESNYPDLSSDRSTVVSETLGKMKETGELVFADDKYLKPDPAPKRGRGRPRKNKEADTAPASVVTGPPRPRGRPPKPRRDPLAPAPVVKKTPASGKPRGRPAKKAETVTPAPAPATETGGVKRGRGRPPKAVPQAATVGA